MWLSLKTLVAFGLLFGAVAWRGGSRSFAEGIEAWHTTSGAQRELIRATSVRVASTTRQAVSSFIIVVLVLDCRHYTCPATLVRATPCLSKSLPVHIMVGIVWTGVLLGALRWRNLGENHTYAAGRSSTIRHCLTWASWVVLIPILSFTVAVDITNMCVPSIVDVNYVKYLHVAAGGFQALLTGVLIPRLARKVSTIRKPVLVSTASILSTCLIPSLVVLYLDGDCLAKWTKFWSPCAHPGTFDVKIPESIMILWHVEVCASSHTISPSTCVRSVALKLQGMLLNKLVMASLFLPASRLATQRFFKRTSDFVPKLAVLVEVNVVLGAPLPLLVPLIGVGLLSESLVAAAALRHHRLKFDSTDLVASFLISCKNMADNPAGDLPGRFVLKCLVAEWVWACTPIKNIFWGVKKSEEVIFAKIALFTRHSSKRSLFPEDIGVAKPPHLRITKCYSHAMEKFRAQTSWLKTQNSPE